MTPTASNPSWKLSRQELLARAERVLKLQKPGNRQPLDRNSTNSQPGTEKIDPEAARAHAEDTASLWNDLAAVGMMVPEHEIHEVDTELDGSPWAIEQDESGMWSVVPLEKTWERQEQPRQYVRRGDVLQFAAMRAPWGNKERPYTVAGSDKSFYKGQFIPNAVMEGLQAAAEAGVEGAKEQLQQLEGAQAGKEATQQKKVQQRQQKTLNTEKMKGQLEPHAQTRPLDAGQMERASKGWELLKNKHGELALHRLHDMAALDAEGLQKAKKDLSVMDPSDANYAKTQAVIERLETRAAQYHEMHRLAEAQGVRGTAANPEQAVPVDEAQLPPGTEIHELEPQGEKKPKLSPQQEQKELAKMGGFRIRQDGMLMAKIDNKLSAEDRKGLLEYAKELEGNKELSYVNRAKAFSKRQEGLRKKAFGAIKPGAPEEEQQPEQPSEAPKSEAAPQPESAAEPGNMPEAESNLSPEAQKAMEKVVEGLDDNPNLTAEQKRYYHESAQKVIGRMTPKMLERFHSNTGDLHFAGSVEGVKDAARHIFRMNPHVQEALNDSGEHAGLFLGAQGQKAKIFLDGDKSELARAYYEATGDSHLAHQTYAHEFSHAIDGASAEISGSPQWQEAWQEEIVGGKHRLSEYAKEKPAEGFAEFGRAILQDGADHAALKQQFPKAFAVWEQHGLVESPQQVTTSQASPLPEIFDQRVALPGGHADARSEQLVQRLQSETAAKSPATTAAPEAATENPPETPKPEATPEPPQAAEKPPEQEPNKEWFRLPGGAAPKEINYKNVYGINPKNLHADPERFQYKLNTNEQGVKDEWKSVTEWNPKAVGVLLAWRDPANGKDYVINGHHRYELAERMDVDEVPIRYLDSPDAKSARAEGTVVNILDGRGSSVDAAKYMRDTGLTAADLQKQGANLHDRIAHDAANLSKLSDRAFNRVTQDTLDEGTALAVAKHLDDHNLQDQLFNLLDKKAAEGKQYAPKVVEEMARQMAATPTVKSSEKTLFGDIESEDSLFVPRAEVTASVRSALAKDFRDYMAVASKRRAEKVAGAGNVLNVEENKRLAQKAEEIKNMFDTLAQRKGPISDALNKAAEQYHLAKTKAQQDAAKKQAIQPVVDAILADAGFGGGGVAGQPGATAEPETNAGGEGAANLEGNANREGERAAEPAPVPADTGRGDTGAARLSEPTPENVEKSIGELTANNPNGTRGLVGLPDLHKKFGGNIEAVNETLRELWRQGKIRLVPITDGTMFKKLYGDKAIADTIPTASSMAHPDTPGAGAIGYVEFKEPPTAESEAPPQAEQPAPPPQEASAPEAATQEQPSEDEGIQLFDTPEEQQAFFDNVERQRKAMNEYYFGKKNQPSVAAANHILRPIAQAVRDNADRNPLFRYLSDNPTEMAEFLQSAHYVLKGMHPEEKEMVASGPKGAQMLLQRMVSDYESRSPELLDKLKQQEPEQEQPQRETPVPAPEPAPVKPTPAHPPAKVNAALERFANRDQTGKGGGLFQGEDLQAREGFRKLKDGTAVVFTGGEFEGQTGKIVHDNGRIVAEVDGRPGLVPISPEAIEPLDARMSWRFEGGGLGAGTKQGGLFANTVPQQLREKDERRAQEEAAKTETPKAESPPEQPKPAPTPPSRAEQPAPPPKETPAANPLSAHLSAKKPHSIAWLMQKTGLSHKDAVLRISELVKSGQAKAIEKEGGPITYILTGKTEAKPEVSKATATTKPPIKEPPAREEPKPKSMPPARQPVAAKPASASKSAAKYNPEEYKHSFSRLQDVERMAAQAEKDKRPDRAEHWRNEAAKLREWLKDHNRLPEEEQPKAKPPKPSAQPVEKRQIDVNSLSPEARGVVQEEEKAESGKKRGRGRPGENKILEAARQVSHMKRQLAHGGKVLDADTRQRMEALAKETEDAIGRRDLKKLTALDYARWQSEEVLRFMRLASAV